MRTRTLLSGLVLAFLTIACAAAAPNFTGSWKLNTSKSDFGQMPPPNSMTQTVTHEEPKIKIAMKQSSDMGDFEYEREYTTDGKEYTNDMRGNPVKSVLKWDGDVLVITTKGKFGDNEFTAVDRWTLAADGKTVTINRHWTSDMGEMDNKLVLEKQ
ncbi:hypothetical protein [uncultured Paludibaculum sp.]|uniref:hypothetical protein n=1 Tax=uncultured Paludibaculum sp. TaxID=1765020 RepID=UPI002AAAED90|nr:hypothetical protein [uncultured Paludibaculum sp.]